MSVFTPMGPSRFLISDDVRGNPDIFPLLPGQEFYAQKSMNWGGVSVQKSSSGRRRAVRMWSSPIWSFSVNYAAIRSKVTLPELQSLYAFFGNVAGEFSTWRFFDPTDNTVIGQPFGEGDGSTTTFQLIRSFSYEGRPWTEPVRDLYNTPIIYVNGVATTAFTVGSYGQIVFNAAPADGTVLSWDGQFCFLCAFTTPDLKPAQLVRDIWTLQGLNFESVKP